MRKRPVHSNRWRSNVASTAVSNEPVGQTQIVPGYDMKLEVVTLPVSDVERAKRFYQSLGWRLDADLAIGDGRAVQFTPPHSNASITIGKDLTTTEPGSVQLLELVVDDIEAARADLISRGVGVSELFHRAESGFAPGPDPERRSYLTYASFNDPDGNGWLLQEVKARPSGRAGEDSFDIASLADLLHETSIHHGEFEAVAPPHNWWDWYAAYAHARQGGSTQEDAAVAAGRYMAEVKHVVVPTA
jgi:catechol 2,3-dioxygenase-like lactoylglutathione lyase family enzyme